METISRGGRWHFLESFHPLGSYHQADLLFTLCLMVTTKDSGFEMKVRLALQKVYFSLFSPAFLSRTRINGNAGKKRDLEK